LPPQPKKRFSKKLSENGKIEPRDGRFLVPRSLLQLPIGASLKRAAEVNRKAWQRGSFGRPRPSHLSAIPCCNKRSGHDDGVRLDDPRVLMKWKHLMSYWQGLMATCNRPEILPLHGGSEQSPAFVIFSPTV